jgi:hypothetical protein
MMNLIGKGLVVLYTTMCLAGLFLAFVISFEFIDWGRAEPRIIHGEPAKQGPPQNERRIASEYDKTLALYNDALAGRNLYVLPPLTTGSAEDVWHRSEDRLAQNHLFYVAELKKLREADSDIVVSAQADITATDAAGERFGKPVLSVKIDGLDKSVKTYREILKAEQAKLDPLEQAVRDLAKQNSDISHNLTGKDDAGKQVKRGLFDLIDAEFQTQQRHRAELDYLSPLWAHARDEEQRYRSRRASLTDTLSGLDAALKARRAREK